MSIPEDVAAKILFLSDRTCCVCRVGGRPVQIHHIDGDNSNNDFGNLAVLCMDCHTDTQIEGGFHRKLDGEQVLLYRNDWLNVVARGRAKELAASNKDEDSGQRLELITSILEILRENAEYELLAIHYHSLGNPELRDKYIEKAISERNPISAESEIFLRSLQGQTELVDSLRVQKEIERKQEERNWSQLARLYQMLGRATDAAKAYCTTIAESLELGSIFSAAYYLKELAEKKLHVPLFEIALRKASENGELWWQVRCLQELGWTSELEQLLLSRREEIEESGNLMLQTLLYDALGEEKNYLETQKKLTQGMRMVRNGRGLIAIPKAHADEKKK